jgi:hypothetical protein
MRFHRQKYLRFIPRTSSGFEEFNDLLNSLVGFVIGGLQLGVGLMVRIGFVMKAAVGQWATQALVKEARISAPFSSMWVAAELLKPCGTSGRPSLPQRGYRRFTSAGPPSAALALASLPAAE